MNLDQFTQWTSTHTAVAAATASVLGIAGAVLAARRFKAAVKQAERRKFSAGTIAAAFAFIICTSVSLNTSYRFTGDPLGLAMTGTPERILSCAAYESLLAMCVLGARERMAGPSRSPGWYGSAVWVFAVLSSVPAWQEGDGFTTATGVRIIIGSFGSALAAHSMLGLELKHRDAAESQAPLAQIARDLRERLMARLGLSQRNMSALDIARKHAMNKAVDLGDEFDRLDEKEQKSRKGRRVARRLAQWQDRAELATNEAQAAEYRARLAQRRFATTLEIAETESPWHKPAAQEAAQAAQATVEELRAELQAARGESEELRQQLAEERAAQVRHMEGLAERVEAALLARSGTPLPRQRAEEPDAEDDEQAECIGSEASRIGKAAAAGEAARIRAEVRVPLPHDEDQDDEGDEDQGDVPQLRPLNSYPTKKAGMQALYRARIQPGDTRNVNQITDALLEEFRAAGISYDRGPAHRTISELHLPAEHGRADVRERELAAV